MMRCPQVLILEEVRNSSAADMYARMRELLPQYYSWWRPVMNYTTQYVSTVHCLYLKQLLCSVDALLAVVSKITRRP